MKTLNKTLVTLSLIAGLSITAYATCATDVNMGGHKVTNVATPTANADAATKAYVDQAVNYTTIVPAPTGYNVIYAGGRAWLDRNVGATQAPTSWDDTNPATLGSLFQWGRGKDGHQFRNIFAGNNDSSATASVGSGGQNECITSDDTGGNSNFVLGSNNSGGYNWRTIARDCNTDAQSTDLWSDAGESTFNGVCPTGWRVPTERDFRALNFDTVENAYTKIKLSAAGSRNYTFGSINAVGRHGFYWMTTAKGDVSKRLHIESTGVHFGSRYRAYGLSVRCMKDLVK